MAEGTSERVFVPTTDTEDLKGTTYIDGLDYVLSVLLRGTMDHNAGGFSPSPISLSPSPITLSYISNLSYIDITNNIYIYLSSIYGDVFLKKMCKLVRFGSVRIDIEKYKIQDEDLILLVYAKYPWLIKYQLMVRQENVKHHLSNSMKEDSFEISLTKSKKTQKYYVKIGIRATNGFASLPSTEKTIKKKAWWYSTELDRWVKGTWDTGIIHSYEGSRQQFLDNYFGKDSWGYYDTNGSIPTIARAAYKGIIKNLQTDTYKEMYGSMFDKWTPEIRQLVKLYNMRILFGGSVKNIINKLRGAGDLVNEELIAKMKEREEEYCGNPDADTTVFLHESCIYILVKKELEDRGIDVFQCYDGFYYSKSVDVDIEEILYECIERYFTDIGIYVYRE